MVFGAEVIVWLESSHEQNFRLCTLFFMLAFFQTDI